MWSYHGKVMVMTIPYSTYHWDAGWVTYPYIDIMILQDNRITKHIIFPWYVQHATFWHQYCQSKVKTTTSVPLL